ncbi:replication initiation protein (plasmid) [Serratia fonticola]|uniref:plasmid replication initiator RepA n=1 Tax=Serratia sp. J2 TaxID=3386551 RepID=UPI000742FE19|nr:replication initiation protein [Serratia fonticola]
MTSKSPDNLSNDPTWENINFDALERAATDDTYWQWIDELQMQAPPKPTKRRRGEHSTACKCPNPLYIRPEQYKPLSGEFGHGYRRLVKRDKQSGRVSLRIRLSRHPYFVQMRRVVGRSRDFRPDRQNLLDATFPLLISVADRSTNIVTMNVSRLANELSPKGEDGKVIPETAVTVRRVCTLIQELMRFGLLELPEGVQWDNVNRYWYPKHVVLSEQFWKLVGVNIDKLYAQQQERLMAEADGLLAPGEEISVSAARKRWYERMRHATLVRRRENALKQKRAKKLGRLEFDDRLYAMADHLTKTLPADEIYQMTPDEFERLAHMRLYQLDLGLEHVPPDSVH